MFFKDFKRIKRLGRYLTNDKKTLYLIVLVLLPVAFAGAIQPLLVGQAISLLIGENTNVWLGRIAIGQSINSIIICLFLSVIFEDKVLL